MDNTTNEIVTAIQQKAQHLQALLKTQNQLTSELPQLDQANELGQITQDDLDKKLEVLIPRHKKSEQKIASPFAEVEQLRQDIFDRTGLELPPFG